MLASLPRRSAALGAALAASLTTAIAIAQAPPDLPPLQPGAAQPRPAAQPAPGPQPAPQPAPRMAPPGFTWETPPQLPPGYALPPGYYPMPYFQQRPTPRPDDYALPPPPPRRRYNTGMWVGGVLAVGVGIATSIIGAALVSSASDRIDIYCDSPSFPCAHKDDDVMKTFGAILMAGGAIIGAAGIPMWLVGSRFVPVTKDKDQPGQPQPARPALVPEVRVGAASASLTLRF